LSNSVLILYTSKKNKRASSSSTTCTETNITTTITNRTGVSLSQSLPVRATSTDAPTPLSACDCVSDDNQSITEQSNTEVDGEKKKRYGDSLLTYRISAFEYARQMGWLSASTRKISDNYINLLQADKDESQAKCEKTNKECVNQGSLECYQEYYSEMEKDINTTLRTQTAIESVTQKKSNVVRPSALEYGRQMGWVP